MKDGTKKEKKERKIKKKKFKDKNKDVHSKKKEKVLSPIEIEVEDKFQDILKNRIFTLLENIIEFKLEKVNKDIEILAIDFNNKFIKLVKAQHLQKEETNRFYEGYDNQ